MTGTGRPRLILKDLREATQSEAEPRTGLPTGGTPPRALLLRGLGIHFDGLAGDTLQIRVSAGRRGKIRSLAAGLAGVDRRPDIG
ncbi:MAG: hypothetical protein ABSB61_07350 [Anaerolineales bacterium]|jgi:prolyl-tRNA editing enzyme YbaK/EbsC (Cys-tRNA(Pro) deacylase)